MRNFKDEAEKILQDVPQFQGEIPGAEDLGAVIILTADDVEAMSNALTALHERDLRQARMEELDNVTVSIIISSHLSEYAGGDLMRIKDRIGILRDGSEDVWKPRRANGEGADDVSEV